MEFSKINGLLIDLPIYWGSKIHITWQLFVGVNSFLLSVSWDSSSSDGICESCQQFLWKRHLSASIHNPSRTVMSLEVMNSLTTPDTPSQLILPQRFHPQIFPLIGQHASRIRCYHRHPWLIISHPLKPGPIKSQQNLSTVRSRSRCATATSTFNHWPSILGDRTQGPWKI